MSEFFVENIRELGGYISTTGLDFNFQRLQRDGLGFTVKLSLKRGCSGTGKVRWWSIFKKEYAEKTFFCLNRTAFMRLLFDSLLKQTDKHKKCVLTHWLKRHCSEAERMAVMWHLGYRKFSYGMRKRNIEVDGVVKPILAIKVINNKPGVESDS